MSRILVTGGAGFIGSTVVDAYIAAGHTVAILDNFSTGKQEYVNPQVANTYEADVVGLTVKQIIQDFRPDVINHHAAQISVAASVDDPANDSRVNVLGTLNVLEAARQSDVKRVIFASSSAVYGLPTSLPIHEDTPLNPLSPYGTSKAAAELYLRMYQLSHDIEFVAFRYANVYGPRQYRGGECGVIGLFAHAALAGEPLTIFGDGEQTRDFVYVGDVAHANLLALDRGNGIINISTGTTITVNELASKIGQVVGHELDPTHEKGREGDIRHSRLDRSLAETQLGWQPQTDLPEGLNATIKWLRTIQ